MTTIAHVPDGGVTLAADGLQKCIVAVPEPTPVTTAETFPKDDGGFNQIGQSEPTIFVIVAVWSLHDSAATAVGVNEPVRAFETVLAVAASRVNEDGLIAGKTT